MRCHPFQSTPVRRLFGITLVAACVAVGHVGHTGMVRLDNGREIRGVIEELTDQYVVIRVGGGRMRLERSRIAAIERSNPEEREQLLDDWQQHHFLAPRFVPEGLEALASEFRRLLRQRDGLTTVLRAARNLENREQALLQAAEALQRNIASTSQQLAAADPLGDTALYNRRVAAANQAGIAWGTHQREVEKTRAALAEQQTHIDAYMRRFDHVAQQHRKFSGDPDDDERVFLAAMGERMEEIRRDFQEHSIQVTAHGSVSLINARINDRGDGRFVVDTGAGVVTISAAFAKRAGIPLPAPGSPTVKVTTADGRTVEAHPIVLESVSVAGHTEKRVSAVILPEPPGEGIDGLLGMSFLQRFHVSLEPSGQLILRRMTQPIRGSRETDG